MKRQPTAKDLIIADYYRWLAKTSDKYSLSPFEVGNYVRREEMKKTKTLKRILKD